MRFRRRLLTLAGGIGLGLTMGLGTVAVAAPSDPLPLSQFDVVVIGAGGGGLTSALSAAEAGAKVVVLEKMPFIGGNTVLATGFMLAVNANDAKEVEMLEHDMFERGGPSTDKALMRVSVTQSGAAVDWLKRYGADLEPFRVSREDNHPAVCPVNEVAEVAMRGIQTKTGLIGSEIINTLLHGLEEYQVPIQTRSAVKELTTDEAGRISGVIIENQKGERRRIEAPAVILATGGFCANEAMIAQYAQSAAGLQSTNSPAATGDGILMAENLGARTVDMGAVTVHPTTLPFSGLILPRQVRLNGAILVNDEGKRFTNETSKHLTEEIVSKNDGRAWLIFDQTLVDMTPALKNYMRSGYFIRGASDLELARGIRVPADNFHQTLVRYRRMVDEGIDADFNRSMMTGRLDASPLYAVSVRPGIHTTQGGLKIDVKSRVVGAEGTIPGLYAVGEVTGGVHGSRRLEGAGLTSAVVHGRIAGREAAAWAKTQQQGEVNLAHSTARVTDNAESALSSTATLAFSLQ